MGQIMLDEEQQKKLKVDVEHIAARLETLEKKNLTDAIVEIVDPIIHNHIMFYGLEFGNGGALGGFSVSLSKMVLAILMEQGKLMKSLPGTKTKEKEPEGTGQYL